MLQCCRYPLQNNSLAKMIFNCLLMIWVFVVFSFFLQRQKRVLSGNSRFPHFIKKMAWVVPLVAWRRQQPKSGIALTYGLDIWPWPLTLTSDLDLKIWPWPLTLTSDIDIWPWHLTLISDLTSDLDLWPWPCNKKLTENWSFFSVLDEKLLF